MADAAIETYDLRKVYPDGTAAVDGVTFEVSRGEIFGCLGRNGAGKTTTVRILTTLTPPTSGVARICGHDVVRERAAARALTGATLQQVALDELMTGREHLELVARLAGLGATATRKRVGELVDLFGLGAVVDNVVATYSGGTRRRLDLALALVRRPTVLFLDEPTTGLDPQTRRGLWTWVREFAREGGAVLLTTQYLEEADALADRVGILDRGRFTTVDTPVGLKSRYGGKVLGLAVSDPLLRRAVLDALADRVPAEDAELVRVHLRGDGDLVAVLTEVRRLGIGDEAVTVTEPTLEDVFVQMTGADVEQDGGHATAAGVAAINRSLVPPQGGAR